MTSLPGSSNISANSSQLAAAISQADFSTHTATVIGYGGMGRQFVKALRTLRVGHVRVCSRPSAELTELDEQHGITRLPGDFEQLRIKPVNGELAIIALPIKSLVPAARHLMALGYRKILIEKPVSLWSSEIEELAVEAGSCQVDTACGYNRVAYPSFHEARARAEEQGGITSCTYSFTEFVKKLDPNRYSPDEMRRWGIANSLHVMSLAHGLIGLPGQWNGYRTGAAVSWHPSGSRFVGAGISSLQIPYSYHADWGSAGRWFVEIHTRVSSYRLCPLEKLFQRTDPMSDWEEVPLTTLAADVKTGFVEQVAAMLDSKIRAIMPLISLQTTLDLTRYGEQLFGYSVDSSDRGSSS